MAKFSASKKRQEYKEKGIFHTNEALSKLIKEKMIKALGYEPKEVLDLCCGSGGLLKEFENATLKGCDIEADFIEYCKEAYNDPKNIFLNVSCFADNEIRNKKYDCIVGNPPFSLRDKELVKQNEARYKEILNYPYPLPNILDAHFLLENLSLLSNEGVCVCLMFKGFSYRGDKEKLVRQFLAENNYIESIESIEGEGHFDDTSTNVDCYILRKNKGGEKGIKFIRQDREVFVSLTEIKDNDFSLNITSYLPDEKQEEEVDIDTLNNEAVEIFLKNTKSFLHQQKALSSVFGINTYTKSLQGLKRILDQSERLF